MFCTRCGVQLTELDRYCRRCGLEGGTVPPWEPAPRLMLDKRNKKIAGVCAGFARYWRMDPTILRVVLLVLAICAGTGFLAYLIAWIALPSDGGQYSEAHVTT